MLWFSALNAGGHYAQFFLNLENQQGRLDHSQTVQAHLF